MARRCSFRLARRGKGAAGAMRRKFSGSWNLSWKKSMPPAGSGGIVSHPMFFGGRAAASVYLISKGPVVLTKKTCCRGDRRIIPRDRLEIAFAVAPDLRKTIMRLE